MSYSQWQNTLSLNEILREWPNNRRKIFLMKEKHFSCLKNVKTKLKLHSL
jgi:hypothetical protein